VAEVIGEIFMKEIIIKADESNSSIKGSFYEKLVTNIFKTQRYRTNGNVNFTGMEFDVLCSHLDRTNETALVECKAKDKLKSEEISKFAFNVGFKKINYGFFLFTKQFGHQVAGLIEELKNDPEERYSNLYFWDAEKSIELLVASTQIQAIDFKDEIYSVTKTILFYSYFGNFYITILSNSTLPTHFTVCDAKTLENINSELLERVIDEVDEIKSLIPYFSTPIPSKYETEPILETIAEIQESDSWYDYKPAASRFFVGRKKIEDELLSFFNNVLKNDTDKRIFYLDGKSGWGKSSFLNEIKGRTRNKHHKNKYFAYVVDSRSANSQNFIALAFSKMLEKAASLNFIEKAFCNIEIQSLYNILQSDGIQEFTDYLNKNNKVLILIFDQFEDVFRKGNIFLGFYKLLMDVMDLSSNIILGFSWKNEVNIPIEHEAYHLWQQAKEYAKLFTLNEFEFSESKKIVKQLEKEIDQKLDSDFIRKIVDNSQGFPWLVKKLCVHIFDQIKKGVSDIDLYNQDFNVEVLFKEDEEKLTDTELKALRFIAQRAYDNNMVDEIEINDFITPEVRNSLLLEKKMIIKTGTKYNIYWDIFRDYLVTEEVPKVGETYLLRQQPTSVFEVFQAFIANDYFSIDDIVSNTSIAIATSTAGNLLRELRILGIVLYQNEQYFLRNGTDTDEASFKDLVKKKLLNHSFYLELTKITDKDIEIEDLVNIIKIKVKSQKYADKTLRVYAQKFVAWLGFAGINLENVNPKFRRRVENAQSFTPQNKPHEIIDYFSIINDKDDYDKKNYSITKKLYDLKSLGFLLYYGGKIVFTEIGHKCKKEAGDFVRELIIQSLKTGKIRKSFDTFNEDPQMKRTEFKSGISELLEDINSKEYLSKTNTLLYSWAKYIYENKNE
jgi:Novel STAND NTPase 1